MTTVENIRQWLQEGKRKKATHVIIATDTFSYEDYPVFVMPHEDVTKKYTEYQCEKKMSKVMEVYNLKKDIEEQLDVEGRNYEF